MMTLPDQLKQDEVGSWAKPTKMLSGCVLHGNRIAILLLHFLEAILCFQSIDSRGLTAKDIFQISGF